MAVSQDPVEHASFGAGEVRRDQDPALAEEGEHPRRGARARPTRDAEERAVVPGRLWTKNEKIQNTQVLSARGFLSIWAKARRPLEQVGGGEVCDGTAVVAPPVRERVGFEGSGATKPELSQAKAGGGVAGARVDDGRDGRQATQALSCGLVGHVQA